MQSDHLGLRGDARAHLGDRVALDQDVAPGDVAELRVHRQDVSPAQQDPVRHPTPLAPALHGWTACSDT